jgi:DNA-directed RNA polymerase
MITEQLQIEEMGRAEGLMRYIRAQERQPLADLKPGLLLLKQNIAAVAKAVEEYLEFAGRGKAHRGASVALLLSAVDSDTLALIGLRALINCCGKRSTFGEAVKSIGKGIEDELLYRTFKKVNPGLYRLVLKEAQEACRKNATHTTQVLRGLSRKREMDITRFTAEERYRMGSKLIEIVITSTGLFEPITINVGPQDSSRLIQPTQALLDWLDKAHGAASIMSPLLLPMVIPPKPWTTPFDGGYLTHSLPLVRTRNRAYLEELANTELTPVYQSVNALQETKWKINRFVLEVARDVWNSGGDCAQLPPRDGTPLPEKPVDIDTNEEARRQYRRAAALVYKKNVRDRSSCVGVATKLWIAERFEKYDGIYFPHFLDWRGRAYPLPVFLNPQADDLGKGLLMFADGKPLGSEGWKWLAIHLANSYGVDKVSFQERVQWTFDHTDDILDSALRPLDGGRFWQDADNPFVFLAACKEWLGYQLQGEEYVSHVPVGLDGAANGLQNLSAMLADEVGGKATSLIPQDKPSDIYRIVAARTEELIVRDFNDEKHGATARSLSGLINRDLAKRPTMTTPYGVTYFGLKEQLRDELDDQIESGKLPPTINALEAAGYLAKVMKEAVCQTVVAAREVMGWLQETARVIAQNDLPVWWTTPLGFPVLQEYKVDIARRIEVHFLGQRQQITITKSGEKLDRRRQSLGIAPNVIHSMDADHMKRTLILCKDDDIHNFAFIHDSFGTLAADTGRLAFWLREAFVEQYTTVDVLAELHREILSQLENYPELHGQIPQPPRKGNLDLSLVRDSQYFFA